MGTGAGGSGMEESGMEEEQGGTVETVQRRLSVMRESDPNEDP